MTTEVIAEARRALADAEGKYQAATDKVRQIRDRIEWTTAKRAEITQRRLAGEATDHETAEFAALGADLEVLERMRGEAEVAAKALEPTEARARLAAAEQQHQRELNDAEAQVLAKKAAELDAALCRCVAEIHRRGKGMGRTQLSQNWRPSETLDRAMRLGVPPGGI